MLLRLSVMAHCQSPSPILALPKIRLSAIRMTRHVNYPPYHSWDLQRTFLACKKAKPR